MSSLTGNLGLVKPSSGVEGWADDMNDNLDKIDAEFNRIVHSSNPIINGDLSNWQRGTISTSYGYLADRWCVHNPSGNTVSRISFTPGQNDVPGEPESYLNTNIISSDNPTVYFQNIEDVRTFAGDIISFNFWTYVESPTTISAIYLGQIFGGGGSEMEFTLATIDDPSLDTGWNNVTGYCTLPNLSGKIIGTSSYLQFRIDMNSIYTGNWGLSQVSINRGSTSYPFKPRPEALEELLCQRYFINATNSSKNPCSGIASSETPSVISGQQYPVTMRTTPTLSIYNYTNSSYVRDTHTGAGITLTTPIILFGGTRRGFPGIYDPVSNPFIGGKLYDYGYVADAELY